MATPRTLSPSYRPKYRRQHFKKQRSKAKRPDLAFIEIDGERTYLGVYGSPESRESYDREVAEWLQRGRKSSPPKADVVQRTVAVIAAAYLRWAETEYRNADGSLRTRYQDTRDALKPLIELYGSTSAEEMGPKKLLTVRQRMVEQNLCRKTINERIGIIKRAFRKAVEFELMGPEVADKLEKLEGLASGKSDARESKKIKPVAMELVHAVRPFVSRQVRAVIDLQLLTGARPSELLNLRLCDLDMTSDVWMYRPAQHKTAHHDKTRVIPFGKKAQGVLSEFITGRATDKPLFSPREAEQERLAKLRLDRTVGSHIREHYDESSYRRAIQRACDVANEWAKGGQVVENDERIVQQWQPTSDRSEHTQKHSTPLSGVPLRKNSERFGMPSRPAS